MLKAFNNFGLGNDFHISWRFGSFKFFFFFCLLSFVSILIIIFIRSSICFVFKPAQSFRQVTFVKKVLEQKKCLREEQTIPLNWRVVWPNEGKQKKTTKLFFFIFFGFCHFILSLFSRKRKVVSHTSQIRKPVDKRQKIKSFITKQCFMPLPLFLFILTLRILFSIVYRQHNFLQKVDNRNAQDNLTHIFCLLLKSSVQYFFPRDGPFIWELQ